MHPTAMMNCQNFFDTYSSAFEPAQKTKIVEIGSQDVNGSLRSTAPSSFDYVGVDFVDGKGVDVVLTDPYTLPFQTESVDIVLSSSCFEHSEMFWLSFLEIMRVLKPAGLFYLNVPSNGSFHRYPVDCWRFYPDSGRALVSWAKRNAFNPALLESYTSTQIGARWNDFVAVFLKDENQIKTFPSRIIDKKHDFYNGIVYGNNEFIKMSDMTEDMKKLHVISEIVLNKIKVAG